MYYLKITVLLALILSLCEKKQVVRSIEIVSSYPYAIVKENGRNKTAGKVTIATITYWDEYTLYRFDPTYDFKTDTAVKGTEKCFLSRRGSADGYLFHPYKDSLRFIKMNADSVVASFRWNITWNGKTPLDSEYSETLIQSPKRDSLLDLMYLNRVSKDELRPDSVCFYFTKNDDDIPFTLSPVLDSVKGMKLYEVRLAYRAKYSNKSRSENPSAETYILMRKKTVTDPEKAVEQIARFKKACGL